MSQSSIFGEPNPCVIYYNIEPYVVIIEQPATDSHIFRYASELSVKEANGSEIKKRNAGSIVGVNSRPGNKTYPTVKVIGYKGPYLVVITCVGKDGPPFRPHPHNLIGTEHCKDGVYRNFVNNIDMIHSLKNVAIERVKIAHVKNSLQKRKDLKIDPYLTGYDDSINFDLKTVRLCFQVFIPGPDNRFSRPLEPVVSDPIVDRKDISQLTIVQLSHFSASVTGGTKMILLCDHVDKNDIEVWFYEKQGEGIVWESKGQFGINDVYKSVAITFKTPPYKNRNIQSAVSVFVELRKPSENKRGEPREFSFFPAESDPERLANKEVKGRKMFAWFSALRDDVAPELQFVIGVPRISRKSSHEMVINDPAAGTQLPAVVPRMAMEPSHKKARVDSGPQLAEGAPRMSIQSFHEKSAIDSAAGNQFLFVSNFNENYQLVSTPSVSIGDSSTTDPVTEYCGTGTTISYPTHLQPTQSVGFASSSSAHQQASVIDLQPTQPVGFASSSSAHQQASVTSHDATPIMQQIHETVDTETKDSEENSFLEQFQSMELDSDPGVENLWKLSLIPFVDA